MLFLFLLLSVTSLPSLRGAYDEAILGKILDRRALSALTMTTGEAGDKNLWNAQGYKLIL